MFKTLLLVKGKEVRVTHHVDLGHHKSVTQLIVLVTDERFNKSLTVRLNKEHVMQTLRYVILTRANPQRPQWRCLGC